MSINRRRKKLSVSRKRMMIFVVIAAAVVAAAITALNALRKPVIDLGTSEKEYLYIPTGSTFDDVVQLLQVKGWLTDETAFRQMSQMMKYDQRIRAGRYQIHNNLTARELTSLLRSGNQSPVNVTFNNVRTMEQLAGYCSRNLEADSVDLLRALRDNRLMDEMGFTSATYPAMFIPNTYKFHWNSSGEDFVHRMKQEYNRFWNDSRRHKADSIGLSLIEVSTLASIIEEETNQRSELPIIAGIYLNRLRIGMPMQACPTLKYALGDFSIRRILKKDQEIESPYNTYKYKGLPPGPIRMPSTIAIDAVLGAAKHNYLFMCAKADGSGTHRFARTNSEHQRNAEEYQRELNRRKIYR